MTVCYLGMGGNLGDSLQVFKDVIIEISNSDVIDMQKSSSFYKTKPLDDESQPEYLNAVLRIVTDLSSYELLDYLQALEHKFGRVRTEKQWDSRTLDLDILLFGEQRISDRRLHVPHKEMQYRDFVLYPLYEIAPELIIPGLGDLKKLISQCENRGMTKI